MMVAIILPKRKNSEMMEMATLKFVILGENSCQHSTLPLLFNNHDLGTVR